MHDGMINFTVDKVGIAPGKQSKMMPTRASSSET